MPLFAYKALAANGSVTTGEIDAADRPEALRMLDRKGLQPVNLKETAAAVPAAKKAQWQGQSRRQPASGGQGGWQGDGDSRWPDQAEAGRRS